MQDAPAAAAVLCLPVWRSRPLRLPPPGVCTCCVVQPTAAEACRHHRSNRCLQREADQNQIPHATHEKDVELPICFRIRNGHTIFQNTKVNSHLLQRILIPKCQSRLICTRFTIFEIGLFHTYSGIGYLSSPVLMVPTLMLLLPLENHRAEPPVWGELAVREL